MHLWVPLGSVGADRSSGAAATATSHPTLIEPSLTRPCAVAAMERARDSIYDVRRRPQCLQ